MALLLILALAAVLRLSALGQVPPGLYHDEAFNGLDALEVIAGRGQIYFAANHGREPLFIYLATAPIALLGRTPAALRLAAAVVGTLTILITVLLARSWFGWRTGLLSGMILAITLWHIHLSRVAFRAVTLPLLTALALWVGTRAWRVNKRGMWLLAGLLYGLAFYSYLPVRVTPVVLAVLVFLLAVRGQVQRLWPGMLWFLLGFGVAVAPLAVYATSNWATFMGRPGAVSVFNPLINKGDVVGTVLSHLARTLGMFFVRGDTIPRHNLPGRPVFDPVLGLMLLLGAGWALARSRRRLAPALLLLWVGTMLVPTWLAEDAPHFLRAVGVLPLVTILPALGLDQVWATFEKRGLALLGAVVGILVLCIGLANTVVDYFVSYPDVPEVQFFFEEAAVQLAVDANRFVGAGWNGMGWIAPDQAPAASRPVYIEQRLWDEWASIEFLVADSVVTDPDDLAPADDILLFLWPYGSYWESLTLLPQPAQVRLWEGPLARGDLASEPFVAYVAFAAGPVEQYGEEPLARFENGIELVEADVNCNAGEIGLELIWRTGPSVDEDYTVFVHLLDGGVVVEQADSDPAQGYYPTSAWRVGDLIVDLHTVTLPEEWSSEPGLRVGLYLRANLDRLQVLDSEGVSTGDAVTLSLPNTSACNRGED